MMDVTIPEPNAAIGGVFASEQLRSIVFEIAELAQALYVERVAKRTGRLAASARASTDLAHVIKGAPRWVGELTVGGTGAAGTVDYAASHEFGTHEGAPTDSGRFGTPETVGAEDLNYVLGALG